MNIMVDRCIKVRPTKAIMSIYLQLTQNVHSSEKRTLKVVEIIYLFRAISHEIVNFYYRLHLFLAEVEIYMGVFIIFLNYLFRCR